MREQMIRTPVNHQIVQSRRQLLRRCLMTASILAVPRSTAFPGATGKAAQAQEPATISPLTVDSASLRRRIDTGDAPGVLLDVRDLGDYRRGHLPGAVHSYWLETVERDYPVYGTVLNQFDAARENENQGKRLAWMRRHGIAPDTDVVAYDHGDGRRAARIVWFLHFLGHPRASMLDGGYTAWRQAGFDDATDTTEVPTPSGDPIVDPQSGFYLSTSQLAGAIGTPGTILVDVRTDDERKDTVDGQYRTGVIPGSIRAPWQSYERKEATGLVDNAAAVMLLRSAGVVPEGRVVLYGRFGCDTNLMWLVLKRAGYPDVSVYDRGWIEWSTGSGLPVEPLP